MDPQLQSQIAYYDARAEAYDDFWLRRGEYELAAPLAEQWQEDVEQTRAFVGHLARGHVLELAAGTGIFTELLARTATSVHAVDAAPAMLARNRARMAGAHHVSYELADLFTWTPQRRYDVVFFGFWLSHVPDARLGAFWNMVSGCLAPGGQAALVDSRPHPDSADTRHSRVERRNLPDGRTFEVVKRYWSADELREDMSRRRWRIDVDPTAHDLMLRATMSPPRTRRSGPLVHG